MELISGNMDINKLWVSISGFGDGNIFAIYPKLLSQLLRESAHANDKINHAFIDKAILPSDKEWRMKIYYQLVEKQRGKTRMSSAWIQAEQEREKLLADTLRPTGWELAQPELKRQKCRLETEAIVPKKGTVHVDWTVDDLVKAGALLAVPALNIQFEDEQEMRRVFSLVYDVLRYKNILNQALKDVTFFSVYPELTQSTAQVWLLLYDLYHRKFLKRDPNENHEEKFAKINLNPIDNALWDYRIRLAASVSRLRIKNNALKLNELLPPHLRDERVRNAVDKLPVSCWVNTFIVKNPQQISDMLREHEFLEYNETNEALGINNYRWESICPYFLTFHPSQRAYITQNEMVRKNIIIVQDRAFCLGPAIFHKLLVDYELTGNVIQTHINSPRATAYLGSLIFHNPNVTKIYAFGAGSRKKEFQNYMNDIGATNIEVFAERLIDIPPEREFLEGVTAVFATPPNSYSAVVDPIDLVCSRGGDLSMLQVLTESDINEDGRKRVAAILEEQRLTLKYAMSRPQIQFVLYETHSVVEAENEHMVRRVVYEMNRFTRERHAELQGRLIQQQQHKVTIENVYAGVMDINNNSDNDHNSSSETEDNMVENEEKETEEKFTPEAEYKRFSLTSQMSDQEEDPYKDIEVPSCDLFELAPLPKICPSAETCEETHADGCYLAFVKRQELTHLDDKYMINIAESRGLFGDENKDSASKKSASKQSGKSAKKERSTPQPQVKAKRRKKVSEEDIVSRISAPTQASLSRRNRSQNSCDTSSELTRCSKYSRSETSPQESRAHRWWNEATRHIIHLNKKLNEKSSKPSEIIRSDDDDDLNDDDHLSTLQRLSSVWSVRGTTRLASALNMWDDEEFNMYPPLKLTRALGGGPSNKTYLPLHVKTLVMPNLNQIL